ncbi:sugar phosphate nucleotidyltransferase [Paenibacillus harenae]|uniref:sugar phosphate nucleotidyltransferase n=1 Tax=Paenibacillus harenae TaxID=306543 RepID=UPI00041287F7|nr:sugar phosphate nucleotidyltransferase [Paenibacillus harenae]
MKIVLLSGGSGKRLWPLSNCYRAKQYLSVLEGPHGEMESMLQRVWRQLEESDLRQHTWISTCRQQAELAQRQAGSNAPIIMEPEQRDTFPAVALAAAYLYSIAGVSLSETVIIMPVDAYAESEFYSCIRSLPKLLRESKSDLLMVGTRPEYPSDQYGYILPEPERNVDDAGMNERKVKDFKEKPYTSEAKRLVDEGALWNTGVYAFQLDYMISILMERGLSIHYEELYKQFGKLSKSGFEAEVTEAARSRSVVRYEGAWKDLGSWKSLSEEISIERKGLGEVAADCVQSQLFNELDIPITVIGLNHVIVAASPDGILVTSKDAESIVNAKLHAMNERPKYKERRWGHSRVMETSVLSSGLRMVTKRLFISAGQNISYQMHFKRKEAWTLLSGEGEALVNETCRRVTAGESIEIPERARHSLRAVTDIELIEVQIGEEVEEDDIIRLGIAWDDIISQLNLV